MRFTRDFLVNELDLPYGGDVILDEITSTGRWESHHKLIFEYNGKLWKTTYSKGLTEYQEVRPWQDEEHIECIEVERFEKVIVDYRPVTKKIGDLSGEEVYVGNKSKPKKKKV